MLYKIVFTACISLLIGIMVGNILYTPKPSEPTVEECLSVCIEAYYDENFDYD